MKKSSTVRKCLLGSVAGVGLLATAGMGTAHAGDDLDARAALDATAETCVLVKVSSNVNVATTLTVNKISAKGNASVSISGQVAKVCVRASVDARVKLDASLDAAATAVANAAATNSNSTSLKVNADVDVDVDADADADADARARVVVTVNGAKVLATGEAHV